MNQVVLERLGVHDDVDDVDVGVDDDWESMQVVPPLGGRLNESQEFLLVDGVLDFVLVELSGHTNHKT